MFQIPQHILDQLRCSICNGYLSSQPILVRAENHQVCSKCFKILPSEEKEKCIRQIGLESLAALFVFPCKYNIDGCGFTFKWNYVNDHEIDCQYRYKTTPTSTQGFPYYSNGTYSNIKDTPKSKIKCSSDEISAVFSYELKENKYSREFKNLSYTLNIRGNNHNSLILESHQNETTNIDISLEGSIFLGVKPETVYTNIKVMPIENENLYESLLNESYENYCYNCKAQLTKVMHHCLSGHPSCHNCKEKMCKPCKHLVENASNGLCRNYEKGCEVTLQQDNLNKHQRNCEFNDVKCPVEPCDKFDMLLQIKQHLKQDHPDEVYFTSEITRKFNHKDDKLIIFCYDCIFKCVYYYYKTFLEFSVTFVGSSEDALQYLYEIAVTSNEGIVTKKARCSNWNDSMLEGGIVFDKKDLINNSKKLAFEINLKIIHIK